MISLIVFADPWFTTSKFLDCVERRAIGQSDSNEVTAFAAAVALQQWGMAQQMALQLSSDPPVEPIDLSVWLGQLGSACRRRAGL